MRNSKWKFICVVLFHIWIRSNTVVILISCTDISCLLPILFLSNAYINQFLSKNTGHNFKTYMQWTDRLRKSSPLLLQHLSKSAPNWFSLHRAHSFTSCCFNHFLFRGTLSLRPFSVKTRTIVEFQVLPVLSCAACLGLAQARPRLAGCRTSVPACPVPSLPPAPGLKRPTCTIT